ncbi:MAG TPA: hypothetical protein VFQ54_02090 [Thermomicrobiales bacterium]|nr:hypothetical protein [Thermomicrobiales bacterium]
MIATTLRSIRRLALMVPFLVAGFFATSAIGGGQAALATVACGTSLGELVTNGGFETPVLDPDSQVFWPDGTGWTPSDPSQVLLTSYEASAGSQSAVSVGATISQTLDTTGLDGFTLWVSLDTATGGAITVGSGAPQAFGWNGGGWGPFTTSYVVGPGESSVALVFGLAGGEGDQMNIDNVSVTYGMPCPTPTPTDTPTVTPTLVPTDTPTVTPTPAATETSVATSTLIPTETPESTATAAPTSEATGTTTSVVTPTAGTTGDVALTVLTGDGGAIPDSASICLADQCTVAGAAVSSAAASGSSFSFTGVASGAQSLTITNVAPYADLTATIDVVADTTTTTSVTLDPAAVPTEPGNATPITTVTAMPTAGVNPTQPGGGGNGGGAPSSGGGVPVKMLPNTGTGSGGDSSSILILFGAMLLTVATAAIAWRRRYR